MAQNCCPGLDYIRLKQGLSIFGAWGGGATPRHISQCTAVGSHAQGVQLTTNQRDIIRYIAGVILLECS
jgi:hypothetical protein